MHKAVLLALAAVLLAGCAEVKIRKVVTDSANPHGKADGPSGLRFYRPRAYVAVNEPFIVSGRSFLVGGELTVDKQFVLINDVRSDPEFNRIFLGSTSKRIPASSVTLRSAVTATISQGEQGEVKGEEKKKEAPAAPPKTEEQSGVLNLKATNDNSAYALTPLRRYFDIVWLPDYEEEYVVESKAGLGNASVTLNLGQGWSMEGIEAKVDNSAITRRILDLVDNGTKIGLALGKRSLGLPDGQLMGAEQGAVGGKKATAADVKAGTPLTIKVTLVRVAAPGLYPLLKPAEMKKLETMALNDEQRQRVLVPVPPLTSIAFNTYDVVVVEAALARDDNPLRLHQYVLGITDLRPGPLPEAADGSPKPGAPQPGGADPLAKLRGSMNDALKGLDSGEAKWNVVELKPKSPNSKALVATIRSTGKANPASSQTDVQKALGDLASKAGYSLDAANVTFKDPPA